MTTRAPTSDGVPVPVDRERTGERSATAADIGQLRLTVAAVRDDYERLLRKVGALEGMVEEQRRIIAAIQQRGEGDDVTRTILGAGAVEIVIRSTTG